MASRFEYVVEVAAARGGGQDRARVFERTDGIVIALADGAGGTGNGATAAQAILDAVDAAGAGVDWSALLADLDQDPHLAGGQSTAVVLALSASRIVGVSAGDSGAWLISGSAVVDLTADQERKPLVGGGCAPFPVLATRFDSGTLLVASALTIAPSGPRSSAASPTTTTAAGGCVPLVQPWNGDREP